MYYIYVFIPEIKIPPQISHISPDKYYLCTPQKKDKK